ncbi:putative ferric-chelate reductase 1 -like protein, partial [Trichinella pseudospiralis]
LLCILNLFKFDILLCTLDMFSHLLVFIAIISFSSNIVSHDIQQETLDECGIKKGCIFHPDGCRLPKCLLALTYNFTGEVIEYEISSFLKENMSNRYIAIGFSDDQEMGNDSVIYCQASKTMDPEIGLGYTTTKNFKIIEDVITVKT